MILTKIYNIDLPQLQIYRTLRGNAFEADNSFIADSPRVVVMLLERGIVPKSLLATPEFYEQNRELIKSRATGAKLFVGSKELLSQIVGRKVHHNVMMHAYRPANIPLEHIGDKIVLLDRLSNMENVGALARSAAALGLDGFAAPASGPHPYGRRAVRVSTGHISRLNVHIYEDLAETIKQLQSKGYRIYAAEVIPDAIPLSQVQNIPKKWALLLGNEEDGISPEILALCDEVLQIEMEPDVKSFNVAIAGSIIMYNLISR